MVYWGEGGRGGGQRVPLAGIASQSKGKEQ